MTKIEELELPYLDMFNPEFVKDPHAHYAKALEESWIARYDGGYVLLDQESMKDILNDHERAPTMFDHIIKAWDAEGTPWAKFQMDHPISRNDESHKRLKTLVMPAFTPKKADQFRPLMRKRMETLIDEVVDQGEGDFAKVARQYPITVIGVLLGVPLEDVPRLEKWLLALVEGASQDVGNLPLLNEAVVGLLDYVRPVIADRRAGNRKDDLLQDMIDACDSSDDFSDDELHHYVIGLLSGGYDTTMNQLIHTVQRMCEFPEEWEKLAADPEGRSKAFIEESLRYKSMFGATARTTIQEFEYRGLTFPAGIMLTIPLTFSGLDPSKNSCPMDFNPDREKKQHLAFGSGIHYCPGVFLAYALLQEAVPVIVKRLARPRINGDLEYVGPFGPWAVRALPIEWDTD